MRIFVASWFFPPANSSEGVVAFKLLSHSGHQYDVCSSTSTQWGYKSQLALTAGNITPYAIATDDIDEWIDFAVDVFEKNHRKCPYDAIMTRSMPPESIDVGQRIKTLHPDIPWIASFGDPLVQTPAMEYGIKRTKSLTASQKRALRQEMSSAKYCDEWIGKGDKTIDLFCRYKNYEMRALKEADLFIAPNGPQANLMLCGLSGNKTVVIPHSYDVDLYPEPRAQCKEKVELVFLGFANCERSLEPFVQAMNILRMNDPDAFRGLKLRFVGNISDDSSSLIANYYLDDSISIEPSVNYIESLRIMAEADWLLHVDAYYSQFKKTGGSVYLAGKLADYIGSGKPIIGLTGKHSPADRLIRQYGGVTVSQNDIYELADVLEQISIGTLKVDINPEYASRYSAEAAGKKLDLSIDEMMHRRNGRSQHSPNPISDVGSRFDDKLLTVCVPAYNVERYLDRCLKSLVRCEHRDVLEVIVVNDGSLDATKDIALAYVNEFPDSVRLIDKTNGGHGSTINAALKAAHGRYFRVLDGDDWLDTDELDKFIAILETLEKPVDLISTDYCQINIETGDIVHLRKKTPALAYGTIYDLESTNIAREYFSLGSTTYRLGLLKECELELSERCFYVDVQYQMLPLPYVKTILFTKGNLYHYAIGRNEQSVSKASFVKRYDDHTAVMKSVLEYYMVQESAMSSFAREYYETLILNNFLKTQYSISLLFDADRARGFRRAHDFDNYLKRLNPSWFDKSAELYPVLAGLRKTDFDPSKASKTLTLNTRFKSLSKKATSRIVRKVLAEDIGAIVEKELNAKMRSRKKPSSATSKS